MNNSRFCVNAKLLLAIICVICWVAPVSAQKQLPRPPNPPVHVSSAGATARKRSKPRASLRDEAEEAIEKGNKARDKAQKAFSGEGDYDQQLAEEKKQDAEAERQYRRASLLASRDPRPYLGLGNVFSDQGRYDDAIRAYKKAVTLDLKFLDARLGLCHADEENQNYGSAIEECKKAVSLKPDSGRAHLFLGHVYSSAHRYTEAIEEYKLATSEGVLASEALAYAYLNAGRYPEAIEEWKRLISFNPSSPETHSRLGSVYEKASRYNEAEGEYKAAIGLKDDWDPHLSLGKLYSDRGRYSEAIEEYKEAIRLGGNASDTNKLLGFAYEQMGRYADAIEAFKAQINASTNQGEPSPYRIDSHYELGLLYLTVKDKTSAIAESEVIRKMIDVDYPRELQLKHTSKKELDYAKELADKLLSEINKH